MQKIISASLSVLIAVALQTFPSGASASSQSVGLGELSCGNIITPQMLRQDQNLIKNAIRNSMDGEKNSEEQDAMEGKTPLRGRSKFNRVQSFMPASCKAQRGQYFVEIMQQQQLDSLKRMM
jgi:hypothetical protein